MRQPNLTAIKASPRYALVGMTGENVIDNT